MIEKFNLWIQGIVVAIGITTIIEMILPENNNKKYIKIVCSLYILYEVMTPLIDIGKFDFKDNIDVSIPTATINTSEMANVYEKAYEEDIKNRLEQEGYSIQKVDLKFDDDEIKQIVITSNITLEEDIAKLINKVKTDFLIDNVVVR